MFNQIWKEALGEGGSRTLTWKKNFFLKNYILVSERYNSHQKNQFTITTI